MTSAEVAERLGYSDRTYVAELARSGQLRSMKFGRVLVFFPEDVERYRARRVERLRSQLAQLEGGS